MQFLFLVFLSFLSFQSFAYETVNLRLNQYDIKYHDFSSQTYPSVVYVIEEGVACCRSEYQQCLQRQQQQVARQGAYRGPQYITLHYAQSIHPGESVFHNNKLYSCNE